MKLESRPFRLTGSVIIMVVTAMATFCLVGDSAASAKATKVPLVIGSIGSLSGPGDASVDAQEPRESLYAWVDWTNAHGGVAGHPVKLIYKDDQSNPALALTEAQQLVEADHVIAIVGQEATATISAWAGYMQQAQVPVIGGSNYTALSLSNPMLFMASTTVTALLYGQVAVTKVAGKTRYGNLYCSELAACAQANPLIASSGKKAGVQVVFQLAVSQSQSDYTAACVAAEQANVEVLAIDLGPSTVTRVVSDCNRQGYHPIFGNITSATKAELALPGLEGAVGNSASFPAFYNGAVTKDFHAALKRYAPGIGAEVSNVSAYSWEAGLVFAKAAAAIAGNPTPSQVLSGLYKIHGQTFGGLTPPITFGPQGQPNPPILCYYVVRVENHKNVAPQGLKTDCAPAS